MIKIEVLSTDRVGVSQEVLTVFADKGLNVTALEVSTGALHIAVNTDMSSFDAVKLAILAVDGVRECQQVSWLPSELKAKHLLTLLSRIPDAIFDLSADGLVMVANQAALDIVSSISSQPISQEQVIGQSIEALLSQNLPELKQPTVSHFEISIAAKTFLAELQPVLIKREINGALLTLKASQQLGQQVAFIQQHQAHSIDHMLGVSPQIKLIRQQVSQFADLDLPVLVRGETGTGKELLARALHQSSKRAQAPFLAINCAALPEHLLESELFGYAPGAFSGARKGGKPGLFELAEGGTVFLDEIAEMSVYLQAKLLRFLQDLRYRRVGGTQELSANVRILSASHQNLNQLIAKQAFRADLYYRLNVLQIELPPLRQRQDDIILLAKHFIADAAKQVNCRTPMLSESALTQLKSYSWPGNIRQLQNTMFRIVAMNPSNQAQKSIINEQLIVQALSNDASIDKASSNQSSDEQFDRVNANTNTTQIGQACMENNTVEAMSEVKDWASAQAQFERELLTQLYPLYPTTRKLAKRLAVSHNKIAIKLKTYGIS